MLTTLMPSCLSCGPGVCVSRSPDVKDSWVRVRWRGGHVSDGSGGHGVSTDLELGRIPARLTGGGTMTMAGLMLRGGWPRWDNALANVEPGGLEPPSLGLLIPVLSR